jgi:hypothetical protein
LYRCAPPLRTRTASHSGGFVRLRLAKPAIHAYQIKLSFRGIAQR